jgi:membrane protease YdiL (CAAX protease family)
MNNTEFSSHNKPFSPSDLFAAALIIQLIGALLLQYIGGYVYQALAASADANTAFLILLLLNSAISYLPMAVAAAVIHGISPLKQQKKQDINPAKLSLPTAVGLFCLLIFLVQCAYLLTALIGGWIAPGWGAETQPQAYLPQNNIQTILYFIAFAAVAPLCEELFFRGFLFRRLESDGSLSGMKIVILTSAAFALFHGNMAQIPYALCAGLILGYLRLRTRSVKAAVAVHMMYNFLSLLPVLAHGFNYLLALLTLLGGIYSIWLIVRRGINLPSLTKSSFRLSAGMWVAAAVYVGFMMYRTVM